MKISRRHLWGLPPIANALVERLVVHAHALGVLLQWDSALRHVHEDDRAAIARLAPIREPNAVFGRIGAVVVFPLKGVKRRGFTHVGKEVLEPLAPSITHGNPATPVVFKLPIAGRRAPLKHGAVAVVGRGAAFAVSGERPAVGRYLIATAAQQWPRRARYPNATPTNLHPAVASKEPRGVIAYRAVPANSNQSPASISSEVTRLNHMGFYDVHDTNATMLTLRDRYSDDGGDIRSVA